MTTVEVGNEWADGVNDWRRDTFDERGARVATVLAMIRNPHRFPSQKCTEGHHLLPTFSIGEPCPCETTARRGGEPDPCTGTIEVRRHGTGSRAVWHMLGLYPVGDGNGNGKVRLATYRKGIQGSHNRHGKTAILMPQGIAQQFYMQGSRYAEVYYREKMRLAAKHPDRTAGHIDSMARVIAAKEWAADLLREWKLRVPLEGFADSDCETDAPAGGPQLLTA